MKPVPNRADSSGDHEAMLLGVGLDHRDGHVRVTRGKNFHLFGGSEETHEAMQEVAIKVNEHCDRRGVPLVGITPEQFREIACKVVSPRPQPRSPR